MRFSGYDKLGYPENVFEKAKNFSLKLDFTINS